VCQKNDQHFGYHLKSKVGLNSMQIKRNLHRGLPTLNILFNIFVLIDQNM